MIKNIERPYKCKICNSTYNTVDAFKQHILNVENMSEKTYFDIYVKSDNEGICLHCGKPTKFRDCIIGYETFCSKECDNNDTTHFIANPYLV